VPLICAHWLSVLEPRLIPPLFDSQALARLRSLAPALSGECQGVLEARLAPGAEPVDLSLRLLTSPQAWGMAERLPPSPERDFLLLWSQPEGPLARVRSVWLELDLGREPKTALAPIVCAKVPPDADPGWLADTLLPALLGGSPPAGQRARILSCLGAMPSSANLLYLFNLRARGSGAVRLEIFGMETSEILGYLRRVAPERVPETTEGVSLLEGAERLHLSFDVTEEILPRIGIEGSYPRQPPREPRWEGLFSRLVAEGLCSPQKRNAALAWPGYDSFWTAPERWPVAEIGPRWFCVRALSHLKIVCRPDRPPEAKVYLAFEPLDRSEAGAASSPASASAFFT
jgi:hypothetical protein